MFQLITDTDVQLVHVNMRTEKHGKDDVDAYDLDFAIEGQNNKVLGLLHPDLCNCLYFDPEAEQGQQTLEAVHTLPRHLRFKKLGDLPWQEDTTGVDLRILFGLGDEASNIEIYDGKASTRKVVAKDGGTATLFFRFSTSAMPDGVLDKLRKLLKSTVTITMVRPEKLREDAVIDGTTGHPGLADSKAAHGEDGADLFADGTSDRHAGDFGSDEDRGDDAGSPLTSDDAGSGRGGSDSEGGETDVARDADAANDAAEFEAGALKAIEAAGVAPRGRRPRKVVGGAS